MFTFSKRIKRGNEIKVGPSCNAGYVIIVSNVFFVCCLLCCCYLNLFWGFCCSCSKMAVLNFNLGVLGHIDSGKTSLAKKLSSVASTACFDKNPQSKERGITLDLGFSSFTVDIPQHINDGKYSKLQFTLVDCPGHASLIKTIIGG